MKTRYEKKLQKNVEDVLFENISKLEESQFLYEVKVLKHHVGFFGSEKKALDRASEACARRTLRLVNVRDVSWYADALVEVYRFNGNGSKTPHYIGVRA